MIISKTSNWIVSLSIIFLAVGSLAMKPSDKGILYNLDKSKGVTQVPSMVIKWEEKVSYDTVEVYDPETEDYAISIAKRNASFVATNFNNIKISNYINQYVDADIMMQALKKQYAHVFQVKPDNIDYFMINNAVIDNKGMIQYVDIVVGNKSVQKVEMEKKDFKKLENLVLDYLNKNNKIKLSNEYLGKPLFINNLCTVFVN